MSTPIQPVPQLTFRAVLLAIILAHLLAFAWFHHYGPPPPPPPPGFSEGMGGQRPPMDPRFENRPPRP
ncbi:MAG: hypothetical protein ACK4MU_05900, partial [Thermomonas sp.]